MPSRMLLAALAATPTHGETIEGARVDALGPSGALLRWDDDPAHSVILPGQALPSGTAKGDIGRLTYWIQNGHMGRWAWEPYPKADIIEPFRFGDVVTLHARGLEFAPGTTRTEWDGVINTLETLRDRLPFWIGDAINFGETVWGDTYTQAVAATGRTYDTLASYAWVCRQVPLAMRRPALKFEYHKRVALSALGQAEKARYLDLAEAGKFENSTHMGEVIKADLAKRMGIAPPDCETVLCPICGAREWRMKPLHKATCGACGSHGEELATRLAEALAECDDLLAEIAQVSAALEAALDKLALYEKLLDWRHRMPRYSPEDEQFIIDHAATMTAEQIGQALDPPREANSVYQVATRLGVRFRDAKEGRPTGRKPADVAPVFVATEQIWIRVPSDVDAQDMADALNYLAAHLATRGKGQTVARALLYAAEKAHEDEAALAEKIAGDARLAEMGLM